MTYQAHEAFLLKRGALVVNNGWSDSSPDTPSSWTWMDSLVWFHDYSPLQKKRRPRFHRDRRRGVA
ncbi:hypothetical protein LptCag_1508 [Leptospirillum ferriphilum]|uniref:Uncharacterized protein n=1 Tax=Leptospirillum ferriphilum TaxID=178606 RepID=A0A094W8D9_9BACT|nr:hypothetical protein LptCag_1508 [Leptospirillum ferriphilum]